MDGEERGGGFDFEDDFPVDEEVDAVGERQASEGDGLPQADSRRPGPRVR